ncbi:MAG: hypothetical protein UHY90_06015 [Treponema sp.]|nr:hypothetical protein [Treponema sp.]
MLAYVSAVYLNIVTLIKNLKGDFKVTQVTFHSLHKQRHSPFEMTVSVPTLDGKTEKAKVLYNCGKHHFVKGEILTVAILPNGVYYVLD